MATDLLQALQSRGLEFAPSQAAFEHVVNRATTRRRNRRIGSAVIALVLFAASDAALISFLHARGRMVPDGQVVIPASGAPVQLPGATGASSTANDFLHFGSAGGTRHDRNTGGPTGLHPGSASTPAGGDAGSRHRPASGPARDRPGQSRQRQTRCASHRFHSRCRPPTQKWRPPSSRGQVAVQSSASSTPGSMSILSAGASPARARSDAAGARAHRLLRWRSAPRRAGPAPTG